MIHIPPLSLQLKKKLRLPYLKGRLLFVLLVFITLLILIPLESSLVYSFVFKDRIFPNVYLLSFNLSGKTLLETQAQLEAFLKNNPAKINLKYQQATWQIDPQSINLNYDLNASARLAFQIGRNQLWWQNQIKRWQLLYHPQSLPLKASFDQKKWQETIATISAQINQPAISPTIIIKGTQETRKVAVDNGQSGQKVDTLKLSQTLEEQLAHLNNQDITIPVVPILPPVTSDQAEVTRQRAEKLLNKSMVLSTTEQSWTLNDEELINFLDFKSGLAEEKIASWTAKLADSIDRPPQNALFRFENGRVVEFKPALDGLTLEKQKAVEEICLGIRTLEQTPEESFTINLPLALEKPSITTAQVNNFGIKELIGKGESWFRGSIASRVHNIKLASQRFNGILVGPGEIFSFNQAVGEIDPSTGYQQAYVIKEGRTVLGDGGGVCQVSTTLFRAVLNAGLPILERQAHAYRVAYYEQGFQLGLDATVFAPQPDLKFKNDTPAHILVQTRVDPLNSKLIFELYGASDSRQVYISPTRIWDQTPPPPDLYQDDPTLPAGVVKQIDWKAWGAKTAFDWKVTRGNETLQERTFYSSYRPWQAIFLRGTGG